MSTKKLHSFLSYELKVSELLVFLGVFLSVFYITVLADTTSGSTGSNTPPPTPTYSYPPTPSPTSTTGTSATYYPTPTYPNNYPPPPSPTYSYYPTPTYPATTMYSPTPPPNYLLPSSITPTPSQYPYTSGYYPPPTPTSAIIMNEYTNTAIAPSLPPPSGSPYPTRPSPQPSYVPAQIVNLLNNTSVKGTVNIQLQGMETSAIDLQLQTTNGSVVSLYLGRAMISSGQQQVTFSWDTTSTPDGTYKLYAYYSRENSPQMIVGPIVVQVANNPAATEGVRTETAIIQPAQFDPQKVHVDTVATVKKIENVSVNNTTSLHMQGSAQPNSIVTLLIYSNPIVVTVKTDANGQWSYTLEKPLNPGKHVTYVVVNKPDGQEVRSEVAQFIIAPAFAASDNNQSLTLASANEDSQINTFIMISVGVVLAAVAALFELYVLKRRKTAAV